MRARWLLPLLLVAPVASLVATVPVVEALAIVGAERLTRVAALVAPAPNAPQPEAEPELDEPAILASTPATSPTGKKKAAVKRAPSPRSVFVPASRVLALANSGARPRGKPVPATAKRPAGLKLSGVTALGLGVLDGDVLTEAAGAPALDSGAVIEAVLRARARQAKTISGTCFRGDERYSLVVEQPYFGAGAKVPSRP